MSAKKPTEELAREWLEEAESIGWYSPCVLENLTALLDRVSYEAGLDATTVATELCAGEYIKARAEERKRCADIVREDLDGLYIVSKSGTHLAGIPAVILRRIEEGK